MAAGLLGLLIWLIVFGLVVYVIYFAMGLLKVPEPLRQIVLVVVSCIGLIIVLEKLVPLLGHLALVVL